ncbi:MAG: 16S rRNA (cytosine(1402)-N(4))-methyltransferase RsmH [Deltaproteobacteria bacterium]|jgi:16S rRNA (cytosine1402-N4)-methyltransferase|nr:16S rRNA (cytosine(1402)-N(4))-methyltransferase RsmH [Deltaproteobacteria bacterium]
MAKKSIGKAAKKNPRKAGEKPREARENAPGADRGLGEDLLASRLEEPLEGTWDTLSWSKAFGHLPVMVDQTMECLNVKADGFYVDCTLGGGGHARAILERLGENGRLLGLDVDPEALKWAQAWGQGDKRLSLARLSFDRLEECLREKDLGLADGLVVDLGFNSRQLFDQKRGFAFSLNGPLDMRLNPSLPITAGQIVNGYPEPKLSEIFWRYGEERSAKKLARLIVQRRDREPINNTLELAALVEKALYRPGPKPKIHPATKVFMALRLAVNGELEVLEKFLAQARSCLTLGGIIVIISFHSLEDRLVKLSFRGETVENADPLDGLKTSGKPAFAGGPKSKKGHFHKAKQERIITPDDLKEAPKPQSPYRLLHKKALVATEAQIMDNPRSRSAKLRAAQAV